VNWRQLLVPGWTVGPDARRRSSPGVGTLNLLLSLMMYRLTCFLWPKMERVGG
jgi:hypothetical protein